MNSFCGTRQPSCRFGNACAKVSVPPGRRALASVGGELSLWDPLLMDRLVWIRHAAPQLALRAEVGLPESLVNHAAEAMLISGVVDAPQQKPACPGRAVSA